MSDAEKEFIDYTNKYKQYGERIILKIDHTFRVEKLCEEIAKSINLTEEEVEIAKLCGLLHDIGRFEQYKKFKTYDDINTIDHGDFGYKLLKENNYLRRFNQKEEYDEIILKAVKYHNKYKVPKNLRKKERIFVNIVRDADKLDLFHLHKTNVFEVSDENVPISEQVYNTIFAKKLVSNKDVKSKTDRVAVRFGFVFDLNFKYSYEVLKKEEYINDIIIKQNKKTDNSKLSKQLSEIEVFLNNYIEEMIKC